MPQLQFSHGNRSYHLKVDRHEGAAKLSLEQDGKDPLVIRAEVEFRDPWILLRFDGFTHRVRAVRDGDGVWVSLEGRTWFLKQERKSATAPTATSHDAEVRAPMTGTVIQVLAQPGDRVAAGDLLAVMEAMKMEYRLEARSAGQVERVHCRPGDLLNVGALIVELGPEPGG